MDKQAPEKKPRGRVNNFMVLAGGYLLYLAYQLVRDAGESAVASVLETAGAVAAIWVSLPLFQAAWELLRSLL